jgi:hypothetical protein
MEDTELGEQGENLLMVNTEEPMLFQEAQAYDCWRKAMLDEMTAIEANCRAPLGGEEGAQVCRRDSSSEVLLQEEGGETQADRIQR